MLGGAPLRNPAADWRNWRKIGAGRKFHRKNEFGRNQNLTRIITFLFLGSFFLFISFILSLDLCQPLHLCVFVSLWLLCPFQFLSVSLNKCLPLIQNINATYKEEKVNSKPKRDWLKGKNTPHTMETFYCLFIHKIKSIWHYIVWEITRMQKKCLPLCALTSLNVSSICVCINVWVDLYLRSCDSICKGVSPRSLCLYQCMSWSLSIYLYKIVSVAFPLLIRIFLFLCS